MTFDYRLFALPAVATVGTESKWLCSPERNMSDIQERPAKWPGLYFSLTCAHHTNVLGEGMHIDVAGMGHVQGEVVISPYAACTLYPNHKYSTRHKVESLLDTRGFLFRDFNTPPRRKTKASEHTQHRRVRARVLLWWACLICSRVLPLSYEV